MVVVFYWRRLCLHACLHSFVSVCLRDNCQQGSQEGTPPEHSMPRIEDLQPRPQKRQKLINSSFDNSEYDIMQFPSPPTAEFFSRRGPYRSVLDEFVPPAPLSTQPGFPALPYLPQAYLTQALTQRLPEATQRTCIMCPEIVREVHFKCCGVPVHNPCLRTWFEKQHSFKCGYGKHEILG